MRVLWFSVTPSLFNPVSNSFNGGGWVASLEQIVRNISGISLGVAFMFNAPEFKYKKDDVEYYPINSPQPNFLNRFKGKETDFTQKYLKIIEDFKPDLIQIYGSENDFGKICSLTNIPVVIHMQGSMPPYHNALFPPGMNTKDFYTVPGLSSRYRLFGVRSEKTFRERAAMEEKTLQSCKYFMGRTEWDKNIVMLHNPQAKYFHCEEALRDSFLTTEKRWVWDPNGKLRIISVISTPWYKGVDLILKTARLLKRFSGIDFEWIVYGVRDIRFFENKYGIKANEVNVNIKGVASKEELVETLCSSTCYVHSSYIDNSPNSLCEAQYLGVPVLATFVGGIPSLVTNGEDGILYPANDPYTLAINIEKISKDKDFCEKLSKNARKKAQQRHDPHTIGNRLIDVYNAILNNC